MLQKFSQQQLDHKSLAEVAQIKATAEAEKAKLEKQKKSNSDWTDAKQEELDEVVEFIVDIEDYIEERKKMSEQDGEQPETESTYVPAKGTEKHVHVSIVRGQKYDPNTGKRISKPYVQMFTFAEWQLFKKSHKRLGYSIVGVLHDPYGDAAGLVEKNEKSE